MSEKTALYEQHVSLNGRMVDFAGFSLPVQYSGIIQEHTAVREACGLFDVSHMGEFVVKGVDAAEFIDRLITRRVSDLPLHRLRYSVMVDDEGCIIDDLIAYRLETHFLLVVNAGTRIDDWEWIKARAEEWHYEVELEDITAEMSKIDIQGPASLEMLQNHTETNLSELKRFQCAEGSVCGVECLISRSGYTGELGYELYLGNEKAPMVWEKLIKEGAVPCGLGARDTLRLEASLPLMGNEMDSTRSPYDVGLGWVVDSENETMVAAKDLKEAEENVKGKLVLFTIEGRSAARQGQAITIDGKECGVVTSGAFCPTLGTAAGMGFVPIEYATPGTPIEFNMGRRVLKGVIAPRPLYKPQAIV